MAHYSSFQKEKKRKEWEKQDNRVSNGDDL